MGTANIQGYYDPSVPSSVGVQSWQPSRINKRGETRMIDFYTEMAMEGRVYHVRAGTITTPLVGDVVLTDQAAEMATSALLALTLIPVNLNISIRLSTGTLHEYAAKSVGTAHTAGTAFIAMPNRMGGAAASSYSTVSAAGGVAVAAEAVTTTRRHWSWSNPAAGFTGALPGDWHQEWAPRTPPILDGPAAFYVQIAATGTGPSYYASYDFIELLTASIG